MVLTKGFEEPFEYETGCKVEYNERFWHNLLNSNIETAIVFRLEEGKQIECYDDFVLRTINTVINRGPLLSL